MSINLLCDHGHLLGCPRVYHASLGGWNTPHSRFWYIFAFPSTRTMPLTRKNARRAWRTSSAIATKSSRRSCSRQCAFQDPHAPTFVDEVGSLFKNACAQGGKLRAGKISPTTALGRRSGFYRKLDTICARTLCDQKALALQRRLTDADKDKPRLFTFLKYPNLQPTDRSG